MQSTSAENGIPQRAVDGSSGQVYSAQTCTLTRPEVRPWWYVNLLEPYMVQLVRLDFGKACCGKITFLLVSFFTMVIWCSRTESEYLNVPPSHFFPSLVFVLPSIYSYRSQTFHNQSKSMAICPVVLMGDGKIFHRHGDSQTSREMLANELRF